MVDILDARIGNFIFALLVSIGQAIFALGVSLNSYGLALAGRGFFGLGGENLCVSTNYSIVSWFTGNELSMAIGASVSISRLASVVNDNTEPAIVISSGSLSLGLWIGFWICILSLIASLVFNCIDKKKDVLLGVIGKVHIPASEKFKFKDIKLFGFSFWCLCINCAALYIDVSCFNNIASNYFQERFGYDTIEAGSIISTTYLVAAILCPVFGRIVDKVGRRVDFILLSSFIITLVHIAFLLTPESNKPIYPIFYMVFLGLGYSIYATVIWASISFLVVNKAMGTAIGIAVSIQNFGLAVGPLFVGYIQQETTKDKGYYWVSFFFVIVGTLGIFTSILLYVNDLKTGAVLHSKQPVLAKESFASSRRDTSEKLFNETNIEGK